MDRNYIVKKSRTLEYLNSGVLAILVLVRWPIARELGNATFLLAVEATALR